MRSSILLSAVLLLPACAAQQSVTLLPRGQGSQGLGVFDHMHQVLTVNLDGKRYQGQPITKTAVTTGNLFYAGTTTTTNSEAALLLSDQGGQIRCDFEWGPMRATANGVCVDSQNVVYDLLIKN